MTLAVMETVETRVKGSPPLHQRRKLSRDRLVSPAASAS